MGEITGRGLSGETHRRRTLGLSDNPIGEFYPTLLHLNPWGNGVDVEKKNRLL